jgi:hypothetical protein
MARRYRVTPDHRKLFAELMATGNDPISLFCDVLEDESAPLPQRRDAARQLKPYFHPRLTTDVGALIELFGGDDHCGTGRRSDALN